MSEPCPQPPRLLWVVRQDYRPKTYSPGLDGDEIDALKAQIRAELGDPEMAVIVLPPACSLHVLERDGKGDLDATGTGDGEQEGDDKAPVKSG